MGVEEENLTEKERVGQFGANGQKIGMA